MPLSVDKALRKARSHVTAGELVEAEELYKQVLSKFPKNKKAIQGYQKLKVEITSKGSSCSEPSQKQIDEVVGLYNQGQFEGALEKAKLLTNLFPKAIIIHNIQGAANAALQEYDAAINSYKQAIKIRPDYADTYSNMGNALKNKSELDAAIDSYKQAIKIKPDYTEAYYNMGNALRKKGELDAAIDSYQQAIKIKSDYTEAYYNMGLALKDKGTLDAAIDCFKQALKITPDYEVAQAHRLHHQAHICDWAAIERDREVIPKIGTLTQSIDPFVVLALEDVPERHRLRSQIFAKSKFKQNRLPLPTRPTQRPKRLRIGYFSPDFKGHPVAYLMAKLIETHDRDCFEVYGYSIGTAADDEMRRRLIEGFDVFDDVGGMSDIDVALLARQDKIDIAIDLTGYTQDNRTEIFAYRAAPIQINFLGYPGTMGVNFIDYIIADQNLIPAESQKYYSEKPIYLPHAYMPTDNTRRISTNPITRSEMGLPEHGFVFCCFNNNYKISALEFDIWMRLLLKIEGSVLWVRKSNKWSETNFCKEAQKRGVDPYRIVFAGKLPMEEHLARHKLADIFLDTFAFNAHTTATEALWAGLPVVTKLGKGFAARVAGSLLTAIDMPELITDTEEEYEKLILELATNPEQLASIKQKLANNLSSKPLFNTELFTKHLEDGYRQAYQHYFHGKKPKPIYVLA